MRAEACTCISRPMASSFASGSYDCEVRLEDCLAGVSAVMFSRDA